MGIRGRAYGSAATLEVAGDALTWRALRGDTKENIATTLHDVRVARCSVLRVSILGLALVAGGAVWYLASGFNGLAMVGVGIGALAYRFARPRRVLRLELADRVLVLEVDADSLADARTLIDQIEQRGVPRAVALP
jgi:hypothetical protein